MLRSGLEDGGDVVGEAEGLEGLCDVVAGDGLFGLLLGDVVGLAGDEGDELDAALDEEVTGFFGEGHAVGGREDLGDNLLDRGCFFAVWVIDDAAGQSQCMSDGGGISASFPSNNNSNRNHFKWRMIPVMYIEGVCVLTFW